MRVRESEGGESEGGCEGVCERVREERVRE